LPWGDEGCEYITDYGFNNWNEGQPDNGGGGCSQWQMLYHRDENVAVVDGNGKWSDISTEPGQWGPDEETQFDYAKRNCAIEWDVIPSSGVLYNLFREEYPWYSNQYPN
jgi:hypothetical protein